MRHLGIDFGERRVGLAISDEEERVAVPLRTLRRTSDRQMVEALREVVAAEGVGALVVGEPRTLEGEVGDAARRIHAFVRKLAAAVEVPVHLVDETLTSAEAEARLRQAGVSWKKRADKRDALAAQILLQEWLDGRSLP